jgi:hypothetical protein
MIENRIIGITAIASLLLGLGIAVGGYFIGNMMYKAKVATNIASVKGLAERDVKADVAIWNIEFSSTANDLKTAYATGEESRKKVVEFLAKQGFAEEEIAKGALSVNRNERSDSNGNLVAVNFQTNGAVSVRSENVDKVAEAAQQVGDLIGQGVMVQGSSPQYIFTKLNDIKPAMLGEATRNARIAAEQFAKDANAKVGNINEATQGAFNFSARDASDENGGNETGSIYKKVRVVTTISFYLEN